MCAPITQPSFSILQDVIETEEVSRGWQVSGDGVDDRLFLVSHDEGVAGGRYVRESPGHVAEKEAMRLLCHSLVQHVRKWDNGTGVAFGYAEQQNRQVEITQGKGGVVGKLLYQKLVSESHATNVHDGGGVHNDYQIRMYGDVFDEVDIV